MVRLTAPWSQLTDKQRSEITRQFEKGLHSSVNGPAGWYHQQRFNRGWQQVRQTPKVSRFSIIGGVIVSDEAPEPLTLEEVKDVLK